jgi:hypothetical protein
MDLRALLPEWIRTLTPYPPGMIDIRAELGIRSIGSPEREPAPPRHGREAMPPLPVISI